MAHTWLRHHVLQRIRLSFAIVVIGLSSPAWAPPPPNALDEIDPVSIELLKLDPDPVLANEHFDIVVQLNNRTDQELAIKVSQDTAAFPAEQTLSLSPRESRVLELKGRITTPGVRDVHAEAFWVTGRIRRVRRNGQITWVDQYKKSGGDTGSLEVVTSLDTRVPAFVDLGDDRGDTQLSGVVQALAGSSTRLYAVPKTGGVWRSLNGNAWTYLRNSPPRAFSIAVDPRNAQHVAVGERDDDVPTARLGRSGLWESSDAGDTWTYTLDPTPVADHQGIPAVVFSRTTSTLFVATDHGVARRLGGQVAYGRPTAVCGLAELGPITALAASATRTWARSRTHVFWSDDDGVEWNCRALPPLVSIPGDPNLRTNFNTTSTGGNDNASLGAFDDRAYLVFKATVPRNDPRAAADPRCNPASPKNIPGFNACEPNNKSPLLSFFPARAGDAAWVAQYTGDNDGRGANGRRFANTFEIDPATCTRANNTIGSGRLLAYSAGQSVQQALSVGSDDRVVFDRVLRTNGSDAPGGVPTGIHSDVWDFFVPSDYCPLARGGVFFATDGGVDVGSPPPPEPTVWSTPWSAMSWSRRSAGLHVQTAQNLFVAEGTTVPPPSSPLPKLPIRHIAYPTQDNESSWRNEDASWRVIGAGGDVNWVAGDIAQPAAILWRRFDVADDELKRNNAKFFAAGGTPKPIMLNRDQPLDGPTRVRAIQTLVGETVEAGALDVVMLVQLPLTKEDGTPATEPSGGSGSGARRVIIRNTRFDQQPDGPGSNFQGWRIEVDGLPADTRRFWVSGGHEDPTWFLYTGNGNTDCPNGLQVRARGGIADVGRFTWRCLVRDLVPFPIGNDGVPQYGPAFVSPYDPNVVVVTGSPTAGAEPLLRLSIDRGEHFCDLPGLTALVTGSGRYPVMGTFAPNAAFDRLGSRFHGYPLAVPSDVGFDRRGPSVIAVASPYTGVYVGRLSPINQPHVSGSCSDAGWKEPDWLDLEPYQPRARAYITGAALIGGGVVVSTAGMSAYAVPSVRSAKPGSWFATSPTASATAPIAVLHRADGSPMPWSRVLIGVRGWDDDVMVLDNHQVRTDLQGNVRLPGPVAPGRYVVSLQFRGDGAVTPGFAKFQLSVAP